MWVSAVAAMTGFARAQSGRRDDLAASPGLCRRCRRRPLWRSKVRPCTCDRPWYRLSILKSFNVTRVFLKGAFHITFLCRSDAGRGSAVQARKLPQCVSRPLYASAGKRQCRVRMKTLCAFHPAAQQQGGSNRRSTNTKAHARRRRRRRRCCCCCCKGAVPTWMQHTLPHHPHYPHGPNAKPRTNLHKAVPASRQHRPTRCTGRSTAC